MNRQELRTFIDLINKYKDEEIGCAKRIENHECFYCQYQNSHHDCILHSLLSDLYEKHKIENAIERSELTRN